MANNSGKIQNKIVYIPDYLRNQNTMEFTLENAESLLKSLKEDLEKASLGGVVGVGMIKKENESMVIYIFLNFRVYPKHPLNLQSKAIVVQ